MITQCWKGATMKVGRTLDEIAKMIANTIGDNKKIYLLRLENHGEARLLYEAMKAFDQLNVNNAPDSASLKESIKEIEEKIFKDNIKPHVIAE